MSCGRQKVSFEGLLQENVLGTFKILRDLAEVSVAMQYQGATDGTGTGYQRQLDEQHVEDIKRFLSKGRYRFFGMIDKCKRMTMGPRSGPDRTHGPDGEQRWNDILRVRGKKG